MLILSYAIHFVSILLVYSQQLLLCALRIPNNTSLYSLRSVVWRGRPLLMLSGMSGCGRKALTLLSSVFAICSLGLLGIAVSTDYWLYLEEGVILPLNQSTDIRMSIHSGLWRVCFLAGECVLIHIQQAEKNERIC